MGKKSKKKKRDQRVQREYKPNKPLPISYWRKEKVKKHSKRYIEQHGFDILLDEIFDVISYIILISPLLIVLLSIYKCVF